MEFKNWGNFIKKAKEKNPVYDNIDDLQKVNTMVRAQQKDLKYLKKLQMVEKEHTKAEEYELQRNLTRIQKQANFQNEVDQRIQGIRHGKELPAFSKFIQPEQEKDPNQLLFYQENLSTVKDGMKFKEALQFLSHQITSNLPQKEQQVTKMETMFEPERTNKQMANQIKFEKAQTYKFQKMANTYKQQLLKEMEDPNNQFAEIDIKLTQLRECLQPIQDQVEQLSSKQSSTGNFTTTLLAKITGNLIKVNANQLTEMLLDELLYETVGILNEADAKQKIKKSKEKKQELMQECLEQMNSLEDQQKEIWKNIKDRNTDGIIQDFYEKDPKQVKYQRMMKEEKIKDDSYLTKISIGTGVLEKLFSHQRLYKESLEDKEEMSRKNVNAYKYVADKIIEEELYFLSQDFGNIEQNIVEKLCQQEFN